MKSRRGHTKCKLHCSMTASVVCAGNGCLQGNQCANHQNTTAKHNKKKIDRLRSRPSVEPQRLHTYSQYDVYVRKQNTSDNRFPLAKQTVRQPINRIYWSSSVLLRLLHIERDISTCRFSTSVFKPRDNDSQINTRGQMRKTNAKKGHTQNVITTSKADT